MGMTVEIQTQGKEDFHFEEALKTLRTNIQFSGSNVKVIMFTSAVPGEGKSQITFSEAMSLAALGRRVLLIDADIRKTRAAESISGTAGSERTQRIFKWAETAGRGFVPYYHQKSGRHFCRSLFSEPVRAFGRAYFFPGC